MKKLALPVFALLCISSAPALAGQSAMPVQLASSHLTTEQVVDRVLTNVERRILQRYFEARGYRTDDGGRHGGSMKGKGKDKANGMPPGLAKRGGDLPPGLAKRGGELPPGLAKRLPADLERELPPRPPQFRRVIVDNDIVLIDAATNKVLDILEDVIRNGG